MENIGEKISRSKEFQKTLEDWIASDLGTILPFDAKEIGDLS